MTLSSATARRLPPDAHQADQARALANGDL
jgi:hypothetical protein